MEFSTDSFHHLPPSGLDIASSNIFEPLASLATDAVNVDMMVRTKERVMT